MNLRISETGKPRLVIIGGGFAGIELTKHLRKADLQVVMIDQHNYHTFQPLLYQVAMGGLEPGSISYPLRKLLRQVPNAIFRMAKVTGIQADKKLLQTDIGELSYDYLVIATGSKTNFFNLNEEAISKMKQLKSIPQALDMRSYILENFEEALLSANEEKRQELMNIAIVGGGPTGVELAGALAEMKTQILPKDYPDLDLKKMQVHLFEAGGSLLSAMTKDAQDKALNYLNDFGVHVWLNTAVSNFKDGKLSLSNGQHIQTDTVIWTAGVMGAAIPGLPAEVMLPNGRIKVDTFNRVQGLDNVFAIGDIAAMSTDEYPKGHPMVAPVAMQQGIHLASNLLRTHKGKTMQPFKYFDKGSMATIGRNKAVVDFPGGHFNMGGFFAWLAWMFIHLMYLIGFRNKLIVLTGWLYNYLNYDQTLRLIIRPAKREM